MASHASAWAFAKPRCVAHGLFVARDLIAGGIIARGLVARGLSLGIVCLAVAGCSADVTRFNFPVLGAAEDPVNRPTGSLPVPSEPIVRRNQSYEEGPAIPRGAGLSDAPPAPAGVANQGDRTGAPPPGGADVTPSPSRDRVAGPAPAWGGERSRAAAAGETIEVQPGDTLHAIARRHGVSIAQLIDLNDLGDGAALKPGQRLLLPAAAAAPHPMPEPVPQGRAPPGWEGRHTLAVGESLYGVARQYRVDLPELQRVNAIAEPGKVRAGTVLAVPGSAPAASEREPEAQRALPGGSGASAQARLINPPDRMATLGNRPGDGPAPAPPAPAPPATAPPAPGAAAPTPAAAAAPEAAAAKFRWPARGRVIAAFGPRADGTHNDGINIALPLGTEIHAAEAGRVAYAGNELKGYGNLVLIRHDNGWVSAYAHADEMLVKRDDVVRRGQVIGRAGKTGSVDQPQLHFELRQGAKPVDPLPHLER
jgi:murein DD-endopeptidase MepM/ murein hydrolase activator NlpD